MTKISRDFIRSYFGANEHFLPHFFNGLCDQWISEEKRVHLVYSYRSNFLQNPYFSCHISQLKPIFLKAPDSTEEEEMKPLKKQDKKMSTSQEDFLNSLQVGKSQN